jgi:acyl transferase domain-containing protein
MMTAMTETAMLLPGQGSQRARMATALYGHDDVFTEAMDDVFAALGAAGVELRDDWLAERPRLPIDHPLRSQPLLFATDYAYAIALASWGVRPAVMLGHSVGELVAAVLAGVLPMADGARLVHDRMTMLADAPPGGMLAVAESPEALTSFLRDDVVVGAVNAPRQTVLAGSSAPLAAVADDLAARDVVFARVPSFTPFHSPALHGYTAHDRDRFASLQLRAPDTTIVSCYTGEILTDAEATDPGYWSSHPTARVLFWPALLTLLAAGDYVLVEAGPGQTLTKLVRRHASVRAGRSRAVPLAGAKPDQDRDAFAQARAALESSTDESAEVSGPIRDLLGAS